MANIEPATSMDDSADSKRYYKGLSFWLVILGINISSFLALLEAVSGPSRMFSLSCVFWQTIISNALPTITNSLPGSNYVWVGSAYLLSAAATMPSIGILARVSVS